MMMVVTDSRGGGSRLEEAGMMETLLVLISIYQTMILALPLIDFFMGAKLNLPHAGQGDKTRRTLVVF